MRAPSGSSRSVPAPALALPWWAVLAAIGINLLWGGNVPAVKVGLIALPPLWSGFWRFLLGALCIAAWARLQGIALRPRREEWGGLALLGVLFTVQIALMNIGIRYTSGALASILIATNPLFAAFFSHLFVPEDRLRGQRVLGLAVAFGGICVIFLRDALTAVDGAGLWGNLVCLASAALLGGRLIFTSRLVRRMETTRVVLWQMLFSLPCFAAAGLLTEQVRWEALGWYPLAGIAYQGAVVAGFNFMAMATLLRRFRPSVVSGYGFLSPVFGVLFSILLLSERLSWHVGAGLATVGLGLYLITRR
jgi:drug/metabolite transporter (DMT)-like permease